MYFMLYIHLTSILGNPSADLDIDENLNDNDTTDTSQNTSNDTLSFPQSDVKEHASILIDSPKYGFANKISGALTAFEVYILLIVFFLF